MVKIASIITDFEKAAKDKLMDVVYSSTKYGSIQVQKSEIREKSNDAQSNTNTATYQTRISKSAGKVAQHKIPQKHVIENKKSEDQSMQYPHTPSKHPDDSNSRIIDSTPRRPNSSDMASSG